jgi:glycosyltransferase involved in cell wall biosynthesis
MADPLPALLVFADDWGRHPSSCQHLIRRVREHTPVLWVNTVGTRQVRADALTLRRGIEKIRGWFRGLQQVAPRMWVVDLPMLPGLGNPVLRAANRVFGTTYLRRTLTKLRMTRPTVVTTLPYIDWLIHDLPRRGLVYYCTDDYSHWPSADRETLIRADREMSAQADLILAASQLLLSSHAYTGRSHYFPHGVDFEHFASTQQASVAPELASVPGPRIGFFGLIYEKINFELLTALARRFDRATLVMIGPVAYCPPEFAALPNVRMLGPRPYEQLPRFLAGLDVLLMPYVNDEMIRQSGPLKLRECLASGKPTVSIDVPDVRAAQPHVRIGTTVESFLDQVGAALAESKESDARVARQAFVQAEGWDRRASLLLDHLQRLPSRIGRPRERRVLHLRTVTGKGGGPEKTLLNSPRFLRGHCALRLAYLRPKDDPDYDMPARARQQDVDLVDIPERGPLDVRALWRLAREVAAFRPHLLHAHDYKTNALSVLLGAWFRIPVLTTLHGYVTCSRRLELYYAVDRWALRQMRHVVAVSEDLDETAARLGVPAARRSLIRNAIDTERYRRSATATEARRRLWMEPDRPLVGAVGRLSPEKGFDVLIRAMARMRAAGTEAGLAIVGEGEEKARLRELARELGCADHVVFAGHQSDPRPWFEAMDVFALSSLREGLPNVVLEAMALEVPIVATRIAGVPKVLRDGESALLVEPRDEAALSAALTRLLGDAALRTRLADSARRTVEREFNFAVRMQAEAALYDRLLSRVAPGE